ncbi:hypothetical protein [Tunicatimonas pelagia]|uniref:hypothetical protein n=1 Tax=Tunicatimonas pelagia TaxID=931531 RepID=UPI002665DA08|nr:hypothetical protein [Tunicatimonas pelagia]WKN44457.1 hypothetical protein P0M28_05700 [Tunicatimonas pelagia]
MLVFRTRFTKFNPGTKPTPFNHADSEPLKRASWSPQAVLLLIATLLFRAVLRYEKFHTVRHMMTQLPLGVPAVSASRRGNPPWTWHSSCPKIPAFNADG